MFSRQDLFEAINIESGSIKPSAVTLFSMVKNEHYFIEAFIAYHRKIGVEQFLILDDSSTDGTESFLQNQDDVVVLRAPVPYGERVIENGKIGRRAGPIIKELIPRRFLQDRYSIYLDADEFLILPPDVNDVASVINWMQKEDHKSIAASLVEFFPETVNSLHRTTPPKSFTELLNDFPFFEARQLLEIPQGGWPEVVGQTKSEDLYDQYLLKNTLPISLFCNWRIRKRYKRGSPKRKTPIAYEGDGCSRDGSHSTTVPPTSEAMLTIAHFVYSGALLRKIPAAIQSGSYSRASSKYITFEKIIECMMQQDASFLTKESQIFKNSRQFITAGLMKWPE